MVSDLPPHTAKECKKEKPCDSRHGRNGLSGVSKSARRGLDTDRFCCAAALQPGIPIARDAIACCSPGCWELKIL